MSFRTPAWRAVALLAVAIVVFFSTAAIVIAIRGSDSSAGTTDAAIGQLAADEPSTAETASPMPTAPPTTEAPAPAPVPEPEPAPAPAPAPRAQEPVVAQPVAAAPPPAAAPPVASSCQSLSAGSVIAAHQAVHPFAVDGGLSANAQAFALTLCNAHAEANLFHSGQGTENVGWVYSSSGCVNDGNMIVQYWMASPAHRSNIDGSTVVGAGVACDGNNTYFVAQYR